MSILSEILQSVLMKYSMLPQIFRFVEAHARFSL